MVDIGILQCSPTLNPGPEPLASYTCTLLRNIRLALVLELRLQFCVPDRWSTASGESRTIRVPVQYTSGHDVRSEYGLES